MVIIIKKTDTPNKYIGTEHAPRGTYYTGCRKNMENFGLVGRYFFLVRDVFMMRPTN